ncbi:hypothetical protein Airi01_000090 [Actinoallomurus iriomotensis]|uniref:Uncharacterized protein n=1 Tax=Actinoallomurus iriomotensis TaxID=478107 RepID=A0A9W6RCW9_9ACTN|nr:hypothetical protein Airi01_000090 [Actinoallomurus iriomotensis]
MTGGLPPVAALRARVLDASVLLHGDGPDIPVPVEVPIRGSGRPPASGRVGLTDVSPTRRDTALMTAGGRQCRANCLATVRKIRSGSSWWYTCTVALT